MWLSMALTASRACAVKLMIQFLTDRREIHAFQAVSCIHWIRLWILFYKELLYMQHCTGASSFFVSSVVFSDNSNSIYGVHSISWVFCLTSNSWGMPFRRSSLVSAKKVYHRYDSGISYTPTSWRFDLHSKGNTNGLFLFVCFFFSLLLKQTICLSVFNSARYVSISLESWVISSYTTRVVNSFLCSARTNITLVGPKYYAFTLYCHLFFLQCKHYYFTSASSVQYVINVLFNF